MHTKLEILHPFSTPMRHECCRDHKKVMSWEIPPQSCSSLACQCPAVDLKQRCRSSAYPFADIEAKWQRHWQEQKTFATPRMAQLDKSKPKFYVLDMCEFQPSVFFPSLPSHGSLAEVLFDAWHIQKTSKTSICLQQKCLLYCHRSTGILKVLNHSYPGPPSKTEQFG